MKQGIYITTAILALFAISVVPASAAEMAEYQLMYSIPIISIIAFSITIVLIFYFTSKANVAKKKIEYETLQKISETNKEAIIEKFKNVEKKRNVYMIGMVLALIAAFITGINEETLSTIALAAAAGFFGFLNYKSTQKSNNNTDINSENN